MGQAWCKERTSKAQDSKSPLDRVFVRCAHRIYPGLKEEGSVLGGATQRVTSSEIGYAGSPPREALARGRSIDSVDRPFRPSDWIDVNLEVPSPPRTSLVLTNLTVDTGLHPAASPTSTCNDTKDVTPVPPPRRRKRNRGRPLPPKPDEILENVTNNLRHGDTSEEPLYLSVKSLKTSGDEREGDASETWETGKTCMEERKHEGRRTKEVYEHKVNGTGRIIYSDAVSCKRTSADKKSSKAAESNRHHGKVHENEEYERFAGGQSIKDSSAPNRQDRRKSKEPEKRMRDPSRDDDRPEANTRTKNYSTVSLPNYDELDVSRHPAKSTKDEAGADEKMKSKRPVRSSTGSLPTGSFLSPFSEKTSVRLEDYIPRRGSVEHLSPYQVLGKLGCSENEVTDGGFMKYDPSKLEDWDLSDISNCDSNRRLSSENLARDQLAGDDLAEGGESSKGTDVVDCSHDIETGQAETMEAAVLQISRTTRQDTSSPLQKPECFGKEPLSVADPASDSDCPYDLPTDRSRSPRYFDPPKMSEVCDLSSTCDAASSPGHGEAFDPNAKPRGAASDTIEGSRKNGVVIRESDRFDQSRLMLGRSLSNESEPYDDSYEPKELRAHANLTNKLIRTISEESLPQEMLDGVDEEIVDFFDEKLAKETTNKLKKDCQDQRVRTPPPSPEPRIKAQILDNDHSILLKVLNDEATEGSNLSSMTPSLTELEAALSDMLEKEDQLDGANEPVSAQEEPKQLFVATEEKQLLEPEIVPVERHNAIDGIVTDQCRSTSDDILVDGTLQRNADQSSVSLEQIFGDPKSTKTRKVSFCAWEEKVMTDVDAKNGEQAAAFDEITETLNSHSDRSAVKPQLQRGCDFFQTLQGIEMDARDGASAVGEAPKKPTRLFQNLESTGEDSMRVPTPPRRRNKSLGTARELTKGEDDESQNSHVCLNDRLI